MKRDEAFKNSTNLEEEQQYYFVVLKIGIVYRFQKQCEQILLVQKIDNTFQHSIDSESRPPKCRLHEKFRRLQFKCKWQNT